MTVVTELGREPLLVSCMILVPWFLPSLLHVLRTSNLLASHLLVVVRST